MKETTVDGLTEKVRVLLRQKKDLLRHGLAFIEERCDEKEDLYSKSLLVRNELIYGDKTQILEADKAVVASEESFEECLKLKSNYHQMLLDCDIELDLYAKNGKTNGNSNH